MRVLGRMKWLAAVAVLLPVAAVAAQVQITIGRWWGFTLDDAFIHLTIARGTVGQPGYLDPVASSSTLWTLLLAPFMALSVGPWVALAIATAAAAFANVAAAAWLPTDGRWPTAVTVVTLLVTGTYLADLAWSGMEHTIQALLALLLLGSAVRGQPFWVPAGLLALVRYEALALIAVVIGWQWAFARRNAIRAAIAVMVVHLIQAVVLFIATGLPAPASVLIKGTAPLPMAWIPWLPLVTLVAGGCLWWATQDRRQNDGARAVALVLMAAVVVQVVMLRVASPRYVAYLWVPIVALVGLIAANHRPHLGRSWAYVAAGIVVLPVTLSAGAIVTTATRVTEIHDQQEQMGRFAALLDGAVVANDVGAVGYYGAEVVDLWGLATKDVATARLQGTYDAETLQQLASQMGARYALVYTSWVVEAAGAVPDDWVLVSQWTIGSSLAAAQPTVDIYAIEPGHVASLQVQLDAFEPTLPSRVTVTRSGG